MVNYFIDISDYEHELAPLMAVPDLMPKALQRALGKALTKLKTMFVRGVSAEAFLMQKHIRAGLFQSRVTFYGDEAHGYIGGTKGKQPLFRYETLPSRPVVPRPPIGASSHVLREKGIKTIKGSFVSQMPSGHIGVFWRRRGKKHKDAGEIVELLGPSVQFFFQRDAIRLPIEDQSDEIFVSYLQHEVAFLTRQWAEGSI